MRKNSARYNTSLLPAAVLALAALIFLPSLNNGLVGWDDRIITESPRIHQLSAGSIFHMFVPQQGLSSSYQPLRSLSFGILYALAGDNPAAFLGFTFLLYLLCVWLFYVFVALLIGADWRRGPPAALAAAALFAVHPVHVEVVSWHQGGKMTLMGVFFLLSLICYLRFRRGDGGRFYWLCLGAYVAALLTQPAAIALPLVLVAWEAICGSGKLRGRPGRSRPADWIRLAPFFLPAVALAWQLLFLSTVRLSPQNSPALTARIAFLPVVWGKSLLKLLLPINICARYPLTVPATPPVAGTLGWTAFCVVAGWAMLRLAPSRRTGWFAVLFFIVTILPTSGLVRTSTLLADRYLYLPGMAVFLIAGAGLARLAGVAAGRPSVRSPAVAAAGLVLVCLAAVSLVRQFDWRDAVSLWGRVVEVYPTQSLGHYNLAYALDARGEAKKAAQHYYRALEIDPNYGDAYANLSTLVLHQGHPGLAGQLIAKAVELRPDRAEVWIKRGIIMASTGDDSSAVASFTRAIEIDDGWAWAGHFNLGMIYRSRGENGPARRHLSQALELGKQQAAPRQTLSDIRRALAGIPKNENESLP